MVARIELCQVNGRASLLDEGRVIDVERASSGVFGADVMQALAHWDAFCAWAERAPQDKSAPVLDPRTLGPCVPRPSQVFAIGLNYRGHAREAGLQEPAQPMVFTKFSSCLSGARDAIPIPSPKVDWEIELVVVVGKRMHAVSAARALEHVAGYAVGQDISDRQLQFTDVPPQFSLAKSAPGFGPIGPALVARQSLESEHFHLTCDVNGKRMQDARSDDMVFPVPVILEYLSRHTTLLPGDVIFTGTPSGVGIGRGMFLQPGDVVRSEISGLGVLENTCVAQGAS